ncbi:MAG: efflux RND transporter periplasmic adaptor subunit [Coxiellaceae bacterium]|nr:efflux RND transporter periplasmic adaptor subunit [Coxiellaceae bacterium]
MDMPESPHQDVFQKLGAYTLKNPRHIAPFLAALLLFFIILQVIFNVFSEKKHAPLPSSVMLSPSTVADVPIYFSAIGTVTPDDTVMVRTQINGTLTQVAFKDGQFVKAGDLLAQIDSRVYAAQILQYQGAFMRDQALLQNAQRDLVRYVNLYKRQAISQQTLNTQQSLVQQYQGTIKMDQGLLDAAQTNFSYCSITSPVTGRIGFATVQAGNFVQTSDVNGIAIVTALNPIDIVFPLPEKDIGTVVNFFARGSKLSVFAYDQDRQKMIATGVLIAIDNQVNLSTGTVNFKAEFQNADNALFPNQFVNVKLQVAILKKAVIVPTAAIQEGNDGPYVYRYNTNHTVTYVPVKVGVTYHENTVITAGILPQQLVVTEGGDKLFNGAKVVVPGNEK